MTNTPKNTTRVMIYGDSLMRGTVIDDTTLRYRATVGDIFAGLAGRFGLHINSRAHFGITSQKGRQQVQKDTENGLDCDFALVEFGGNDCSFHWDEVAADPTREHLPLTPLQSYEAALTDMVCDLRTAGATPLLMTLPPIDAERHLHFVGKNETGRKNILQWLGDSQMIYRFHELYSNTICKVAGKTKTILVDVRSRFLARHDLRQLVGLDGVHLNQAGYAAVAEVFADFIRAHRSAPAALLYA